MEADTLSLPISPSTVPLSLALPHFPYTHSVTPRRPVPQGGILLLGLWSVRIRCLFKVPGLQDSVVVTLKGQMGWNREVPHGRPCCLALGGRTWGEIHGSWASPQCLLIPMFKEFLPFPLSDYRHLKTGRIHIKIPFVLTQPTLAGIALRNRDLRLWRWDLLQRNQVVQLPALGPCPALDGSDNFGVES